jgi:hypothetical protein
VSRRGRTRRRLSRTFSSSRFDDYTRLLQRAIERGYKVRALEDWIVDPDRTKPPVLILRHDVDQHPRSVLPLLAAERALDLRSTWYFRWRTAHPKIVEEVRRSGSDVGLHYETLTRLVLASGRERAVDDALLEEARGLLRLEIEAFAERFGPVRSVCPHGDTRVPHVRNSALLEGADPSDYGVEFDGNFAVRHRPLGHWLTDRSRAEGGWKDGVNPLELLDAHSSPILCLTHPNNFASGPGLWLDRMLSAVVPDRLWSWPVRTGRDQPPLTIGRRPEPAQTARRSTAPRAR